MKVCQAHNESIFVWKSIVVSAASEQAVQAEALHDSFLDDLSWPKNNLVNNLLPSKESSLRSLAS